MSFKGAILGDIAGSRWEFNRPKDLDWQHIDLFTPECFFTDDTVMTLACKWAVQNDSQYAFAYREFYRRYPGAGYDGKAFRTEGIFPMPVSGYASIGAGRDFANAAMHLGHSPREAVKVACDLSCYVAEPILEETMYKI